MDPTVAVLIGVMGLVVIPIAVIVAITCGALILLGLKLGIERLRERKGHDTRRSNTTDGTPRGDVHPHQHHWDGAGRDTDPRLGQDNGREVT